MRSQLTIDEHDRGVSITLPRRPNMLYAHGAFVALQLTVLLLADRFGRGVPMLVGLAAVMSLATAVWSATDAGRQNALRTLSHRLNLNVDQAAGVGYREGAVEARAEWDGEPIDSRLHSLAVTAEVVHGRPVRTIERVFLVSNDGAREIASSAHGHDPRRIAVVLQRLLQLPSACTRPIELQLPNAGAWMAIATVFSLLAIGSAIAMGVVAASSAMLVPSARMALVAKYAIAQIVLLAGCRVAIRRESSRVYAAAADTLRSHNTRPSQAGQRPIDPRS